MGNRAIIRTETGKIGIYLHWNGGRDSVTAFLEYCNRRGFRKPEQDSYGWARLCQVVANFFGGDLSIGIEELNGHDGEFCDNGTYIIKDWKIIGREDFDGIEQDNYDLEEMIRDIDASQPEQDRIYVDKTTECAKMGV